MATPTVETTGSAEAVPSEAEALSQLSTEVVENTLTIDQPDTTADELGNLRHSTERSREQKAAREDLERSLETIPDNKSKVAAQVPDLTAIEAAAIGYGDEEGGGYVFDKAHLTPRQLQLIESSQKEAGYQGSDLQKEYLDAVIEGKPEANVDFELWRRNIKKEGTFSVYKHQILGFIENIKSMFEGILPKSWNLNLTNRDFVTFETLEGGEEEEDRAKTDLEIRSQALKIYNLYQEEALKDNPRIKVSDPDVLNGLNESDLNHWGAMTRSDYFGNQDTVYGRMMASGFKVKQLIGHWKALESGDFAFVDDLDGLRAVRRIDGGPIEISSLEQQETPVVFSYENEHYYVPWENLSEKLSVGSSYRCIYELVAFDRLDADIESRMRKGDMDLNVFSTEHNMTFPSPESNVIDSAAVGHVESMEPLYALDELIKEGFIVGFEREKVGSDERAKIQVIVSPNYYYPVEWEVFKTQKLNTSQEVKEYIKTIKEREENNKKLQESQVNNVLSEGGLDYRVRLERPIDSEASFMIQPSAGSAIYFDKTGESWSLYDHQGKVISTVTEGEKSALLVSGGLIALAQDNMNEKGLNVFSLEGINTFYEDNGSIYHDNPGWFASDEEIIASSVFDAFQSPTPQEAEQIITRYFKGIS